MFRLNNEKDQREKLALITGHNEVVAKVMFLLVSVILSTRGGGLPQCMLGYHTPPPLGSTHALPREARTPPPPGKQTPAFGQ